jgi:hypothetical protein
MFFGGGVMMAASGVCANAALAAVIAIAARVGMVLIMITCPAHGRQIPRKVQFRFHEALRKDGT